MEKLLKRPDSVEFVVFVPTREIFLPKTEIGPSDG